MKLALRTAAALSLGLPLWGIDPSLERNSLVTHEWGTFTSVAAEDGSPMRWAPLSGPPDLPCFVANLGPGNFKGIASGLVRMETPVLYFYSSRPVKLAVRVGFPEGWITEWYPNATQVTPAYAGPATQGFRGGEIRWDSVEVSPGENPLFPSGKRASHYYAARETDSAPVRIGKEWEKMIFYRGVGDFSIPLQPAFTREGRLRIRNIGAESIPLVMLFENRAGKIGYRITSSSQHIMEMDPPELVGNLEALRRELTNQLIEFGLYRKEAAAMVETWRESWFEDGMRLFYIVPRAMVDTVLPLEIKPAPASTARVFVGRIELLSPGVREEIHAAAAAGDVERLAKRGRFLGPFVTRMERANPEAKRPAAIQAVFQQRSFGPGCVE